MARDPLWDEIENAFRKHFLLIEDQTPQVNLNRIAGKCFLAWLQPEICAVRKESIPFGDLKTLKLFDQPTTPPAWEVEPIIILQIESERYVIDGRRRVKKWIEDGIDKPRTAIIIAPSQWRKWPQTWSADKPKRTGWYWYRATAESQPYPVKIFDANVLYVWPINDRVTEKENVTVRLSDCPGEFAGPMEPPA